MDMGFRSSELRFKTLQMGHAEARRSAIAKNAKKSLKDLRSGKLEAMTADDLIKKLEIL